MLESGVLPELGVSEYPGISGYAPGHHGQSVFGILVEFEPESGFGMVGAVDFAVLSVSGFGVSDLPASDLVGVTVFGWPPRKSHQ